MINKKDLGCRKPRYLTKIEKRNKNWDKTLSFRV